MALFSKPPAKKPDAIKPNVKPAAASARAPVSARDVAVQAQGRRSAPERPRAEPAGEISVSGASMIEWSPRGASIEVAQSNPGLCAVLENAALLFASGQTAAARNLLEQGMQNDADTRNSPLAWLALFDLMQRAHDRAGFDQFALQYVVQFERSPPPWEDGIARRVPQAKATAGGYTLLTGKLNAASAPQIETLRKAMAKPGLHTRLDLAQVAGFDDAGAQLLASALAEARKLQCPLTLQRTDKIRAALDILVRRGRDAGEGAWQLSLEFLQFDQKQDAFEDRAIEYAVAFEQSPPSWDPPPVTAVETPVVDSPDATADSDERTVGAGVELIAWSGVMTGSSTTQMAQISEHAHGHPVVPIDMSAIERIDFVCAGALLNAINRVETQRKAVQIVGASPIIRALLMLIGISPRHFLKKPQ